MVKEDEHTFYLTKSVSFLGTECPFSEAKYFFFGVPYDLTSSFRPGSRFGPDSVRRFSANIEANSYRKQFNTERAKVYDGGDIVYTPRLSTMLRRVHQVVKTAVSAGKTPVMVGGEHTFTLPAVHATLKKPSALIVFDAHFDLRDEYAGLKLNHATYLRRLLNRRPDISVLVVGVRGYDPSEEQYAVEKGVRFVKSHEAEDVSRLSRLMADTVGGKDLYVSVDIDVLDPAYAPGVGNPEPEGLTPSQLFDLIHLLDGRRLRGFDVVEVNPIYDNGSTASVAAKTLMELVALAEES